MNKDPWDSAVDWPNMSRLQFCTHIVRLNKLKTISRPMLPKLDVQDSQESYQLALRNLFFAI